MIATNELEKRAIMMMTLQVAMKEGSENLKTSIEITEPEHKALGGEGSA